MADEKPDVIKIAGQEITMFSWSMASRLAAVFSNPETLPDGQEPLTLKHQMAIAFQAGYDVAEKRGLPLGVDVEGAIRACEEAADKLRTFKRKMT